jgi:ribosomal protein S18 acetylase RimI-like enzyme
VKAMMKHVDQFAEISTAVFGDTAENARSMTEKALLSGSREGFAAEYNGQTIGMVFADYEQHDPLIFGLGLLPEFQGEGFGKQFLSLLIDHLFSRGARKVKLEVDSNNKRAIHLYQQLGFAVLSGFDYYRAAVLPNDENK